VVLTKSDPNFAFFSAEPDATSPDTSFNGNFLEIRDHLKVQSDFFFLFGANYVQLNQTESVPFFS
jgi:hypothetical protein